MTENNHTYYEGLHMGEALDETVITTVSPATFSDINESQNRNWHNPANSNTYNTLPV